MAMADNDVLKRMNKLEMEIMRLQAQNNMLKLLVIGSLEAFGKRIDQYDAHARITQFKGSVWITNGSKDMRWYDGDIPKGWVRGRITDQTSQEKVDAIHAALAGEE